MSFVPPTAARVRLLYIWYILTILFLFLFSYTQVDLNLTLSQISIWQTIQKTFQHIGFYQRPVATAWYIALLGSMTGVYLSALSGVRHGWIAKKQLWAMILFGALVLAFSYPATSYDIFNHMFTAKTVLIYHQNPYAVTPLEFAGVEPWLSFLRWTHVVSIYSPLWIVITLLPYLLGFGYFLLILWNFKLMVAGFYLLTAYFIGKTLEKDAKSNALFAVAVFALNPLVLIESLVGAHNDIVMMACSVMMLYFVSRREMVWAFGAYALSVASKLMTALLFPVFFFPKVKWLPLALMSVGTLGFLLVTKREVMPWYFLWIMPFVALYPFRRWILTLSLGISLGLLLRYAPFFYFGDWNDPVPMIKIWVSAVPIGLSVVIAAWQGYMKKN